jgi:hypothetical protein
MVKFFGILVFIFAPLILVGLAVGRKLEENEERIDRDRAIREGMTALKKRILNLEKIRSVRRERS